MITENYKHSKCRVVESSATEEIYKITSIPKAWGNVMEESTVKTVKAGGLCILLMLDDP